MKHCDETGLFAIVCRHDVPLLLRDSYAGERFESVVDTIRAFIDVFREDIGSPPSSTILTYDVACRLAPYLATNHPDLAASVTVVVNKFHGMAHELRCQVIYGAMYQEGLGETDGEGVERFWSFLKWLVAAGRESSAPNRRVFLEDT
ncbi:hypothetical protein BJ508DRAFT_211989 [Ascobolus immersus RN42]|uniref:Uncharacterized protein n=1 Tax=Ascobolus immersus RN42 TaxID=1160509 RepID=A0A3N4I1K3_ASCIM|nr:hypothetical protein BJ508DRAFT_211989 [Ascobolus immersus RN42]